MFNKLSNKELVTVTHDLAKTLGADTPLLDVAKLLAESAMRLDVAVVRVNELQKKLDAAAEDNVVLSIKKDELYHFIREYCWVQDGPPDNCDSYVPAENSEMIPDTDYASKNESYLNAVRAEGIHFAVNRMLAAWESGFINDMPEQTYDITGGFLTALEFLPNASPEELTSDYHAEVRSAIAKSRNADAAKDGV